MTKRKAVLINVMLLVLGTLALIWAAKVQATEPPVYVSIPRLEIESEVVPVGQFQVTIDGVTGNMWDTSEEFVAWHNTSGVPGSGNMVLNGHNWGTYGVFMDLPQIRIGDEVIINDKYRYAVTGTHIVWERGAPVAQRIRNARFVDPAYGGERLTLVTCISWTHMIIVVARPIESLESLPPDIYEFVE